MAFTCPGCDLRMNFRVPKCPVCGHVFRPEDGDHGSSLYIPGSFPTETKTPGNPRGTGHPATNKGGGLVRAIWEMITNPLAYLPLQKSSLEAVAESDKAPSNQNSSGSSTTGRNGSEDAPASTSRRPPLQSLSRPSRSDRNDQNGFEAAPASTSRKPLLQSTSKPSGSDQKRPEDAPTIAQIPRYWKDRTVMNLSPDLFSKPYDREELYQGPRHLGKVRSMIPALTERPGKCKEKGNAQLPALAKALRVEHGSMNMPPNQPAEQRPRLTSAGVQKVNGILEQCQTPPPADQPADQRPRLTSSGIEKVNTILTEPPSPSKQPAENARGPIEACSGTNTNVWPSDYYGSATKP